MNFLNPGFLFALLALTIPVIIHLFNFRKFKKVYFTNVQFLKEVQEQNSSREKLRNIWVLIARLLALFFLILAFSRPYINTDTAYKNGSLQQTVSIYIDNSYSMEAVNKEGSLLENAKRSAIEVAKNFDLNTKFVLITNDFEGKHQRELSFEDFKNAVEEVQISAANKTLQEVVNRQNGNPNSYLYVVSDFQKSFAGDKIIHADSSVNIALIKLTANNLPNVAVDSAWFISPVHRPNNEEQLVVKLHNYGDATAKNIPLKVMINGQPKSAIAVTIPGKSTKIDTLKFGGLGKGWQQVLIGIKDYPLTFDDQLRLAFKVNESMSVLSINGSNSDSYLKALFGADNFFNLSEMNESNIQYAEFAKYNLIVLNEVSMLSSGLSLQLSNYVKSGGSLVVFPNLSANKEVFSKFLNGLSLPNAEALLTEQARVVQLDFKNQLFKGVFETFPKNLDLPTAKKFFVYGKNSSETQPLLQMQAGRTFLNKYAIGLGSIYLFASSLNPEENNLAQHPLFVPMLYKMAFLSLQEQKLFYTAGKDNFLEVPTIRTSANQSLKLKSPDFEVIPELSQVNGRSKLYVADQIKQAGFYSLYKADSLIALYAFNNSGNESDMVYSSTSEVESKFNNHHVSAYDIRNDSLPNSKILHADGIELWKWCVVLALLFLLAELLLVKFYTVKN